MVLAEKTVTASQRGITSTRWRDFADIYLLTGQHRLVAGDMRAAINKVSTYRNAEMGHLRPVLDGYPAVAQAKWHAWRTRQNLEDRLPADFHEVLESVLSLPTGCSTPPVRAKQTSGHLAIGPGASSSLTSWPPRCWPPIGAMPKVRAGQASVCVWVQPTGLSHAPETARKTTRRAPSRNTQPIPIMLKGLDTPQPT